MELTPIKYAPV